MNEDESTTYKQNLYKRNLNKTDELKIVDPPIWDKQEMLERLMDDEVQVTMLLECFLSDIPQQIQALKAFLEDGDALGTERQAHTIKGLAANFGGKKLAAVAFEMEKLARNQNLTCVGAFVNDLETQFERLKEAILATDIPTTADGNISPRHRHAAGKDGER